MNGIENDLEKLDENLKNGRCESAFMVIVDDEGRIDNKRVTDWKEKYPDIQILLCQCNITKPEPTSYTNPKKSKGKKTIE